MKRDVWHGCYDTGWSGLLVPDAFSHPAKMARGLAERIYQHALEQRWCQLGDIVIDPFGGIAGCALSAMQHGLHFVGVELELKFCQIGGEGWGCPGNGALPEWHDKIQCKEAAWPICAACLADWRKGRIFEAHHAEGNLELWRRKYGKLPGWGTARLLQGDSRVLAEVLRGANLCVSSPPYTESSIVDARHLHFDANRAAHSIGAKRRNGIPTGYGATPGNLGNMKPGDVQAILSVGSPPFGTSLESKDQQFQAKARPGRTIQYADYGDTPGNLGNETTTFWAAAREILLQLYAVLSEGSHAIFVTKRFCRAGCIVEFSDQWKALCLSAGFKLCCQHRAMLKEEWQEPDLFTDPIKKVKKRVSFFRRLHEKKRPDLAIDWEDALCFVRP